MLKYSKVKALLLIFLFVVFGCTTKKYSFTVNAPPKYSSEYTFKTMKIQSFKSNKKK